MLVYQLFDIKDYVVKEICGGCKMPFVGEAGREGDIEKGKGRRWEEVEEEERERQQDEEIEMEEEHENNEKG